MSGVRFAIIEHNILTGLGLKQLLTDLLPMAEIELFSSFEEMDTPDDYIHYFVSSNIYFEHVDFFRSNPHKSIVLVSGDMKISGVATLNVYQSEKDFAKDIINIRNHGHKQNIPEASKPIIKQTESNVLSARECEVAILLAKGFINKEIAGKLNISITTVMTHRKNIMDKLHARSLADIVIFTVMNGLTNLNEL